MKKRIFKFGAALTAALMICSATAGLAFADEIDAETPETTEPAVVETVDEAAPAEEAVEEETPAEEAEAPAEEAEDVEEVVVPLETEDITAEDVAEAEAEAAALVPDVPTGSAIAIGDITSTSDESYYTVSVPFTVNGATPSQMTLFVYNITAIAGDQNNTVGFSAETPVGYIDQSAGQPSGTYTFKLSKTGENAYKDGDIIVVKIGGTGIDTPDAKSYTLTGGGEGPAPEVKLGDVDSNTLIDMDDANLVMQFYLQKTELSDAQKKAADVTKNDVVDMDDANLIMQYYLQKITSFE